VKTDAMYWSQQFKIPNGSVQFNFLKVEILNNINSASNIQLNDTEQAASISY